MKRIHCEFRQALISLLTLATATMPFIAFAQSYIPIHHEAGYVSVAVAGIGMSAPLPQGVSFDPTSGVVSCSAANYNASTGAHGQQNLLPPTNSFAFNFTGYCSYWPTQSGPLYPYQVTGTEPFSAEGLVTGTVSAQGLNPVAGSVSGDGAAVDSKDGLNFSPPTYQVVQGPNAQSINFPLGNANATANWTTNATWTETTDSIGDTCYVCFLPLTGTVTQNSSDSYSNLLPYDGSGTTTKISTTPSTPTIQSVILVKS